jgi:hypothetical protein
LSQSIYRVDCKTLDNKQEFVGILERNRQDYSETQGYLLVPVNCKLDNGTLLLITTGFESNEYDSPLLQKEQEYWMVWWAEEIAVSGYNKYTVLKMTHDITWNGVVHKGYFSGPGTQTMIDTSKSSTINSLYRERTTLYMFITPYAADIQKEQYFEVAYPDELKHTHKLGFVVTDVDFVSTNGVLYVSADPSYERDLTAKPSKPENPSVKDNEDFYWLNPNVNKEDR